MPGTGRIAYGRRATPSGGALGAGGSSPSNGSSNGGTNLSAGGNTHTGSSLVASAQASSDLPLIVQLDQVGDARGATLHGTVNLGGQNEILDRFGALAPQGGWLRINLALYDANPVARAASQLSHAKSRGWNVLVTAMGCPEHLASDSTVSPPGSPLPDWGSSVPNDPRLWAEEVVRSLYELRRQTGFLPDFLEIGNEPDRPEYWSGTLADYLEVYAATSGLVRAHFPSIKLGAMGLAGSESTMGGEESALITALKDARNRSLPLDFLSWHHYGQASEIRYTNIVERLRAADVATAGDGGAAPLQLVVSEWNIAPNAWERDGGFDNSHAAANYAAFQEHARQLGLDAACFFMTQDIDDPAGIHDLGGFSVGALTRRGIKKPVWRVMEVLGSMAQDAHVPVRLPFDEYGLTATGSLSGDRLRILVANDSVEPSWVFKNGCIEKGLRPGVIQQRLQNSGLTRASNPTVEVLHNAGFDYAEAVSLSDILNRVTEAQRLKQEARTVKLNLGGTKNFQVTGVRRFDSTHNAPAIHRNILIPHLQSVEAAAQNSAATAGDLLLVALGFPAVGHVPNLSLSIGALAIRYNLPVRVARAWRDTTESMLVRTRIAQLDLLDQVPGASLEPLEYGSEAGVVIQGERVSFQMEPDSVFLLEIDL